MAMKDDVLRRALDLPSEDRKEIAHKLYQSLVEEDQEELDEKAWEEEWGDELLRRIDDLKSGRVKGVDGMEVIRKMKEEIAARNRKKSSR